MKTIEIIPELLEVGDKIKGKNSAIFLYAGRIGDFYALRLGGGVIARNEHELTKKFELIIEE